MLKENNKCFTEESKILFLFKFVKCISKLKMHMKNYPRKLNQNTNHHCHNHYDNDGWYFA